MKKESLKQLFIVTIFSIAMAFLESVIVVYLRKIYYPNGFDFPLVGFIDPNILSIEWFREFCTIIMLIAIALLAAKKFSERFAYFMFSFAIWDIFYYIWLWVMLSWPKSIFTWDLLFLIPWPWIGPVLAPVILSLTMIIFAIIILNKPLNIKLKEWTLLILGSLVVLYTFLIDYGKLIFLNGFAAEFFSLSTNSQFASLIEKFTPIYFNWPIFLFGELLIVMAIILFHRRKL